MRLNKCKREEKSLLVARRVTSVVAFAFLPQNFEVVRTYVSGADPGGAPGAGPPPTLGFEAPKLSIFGPYLIFP